MKTTPLRLELETIIRSCLASPPQGHMTCDAGKEIKNAVAQGLEMFSDAQLYDMIIRVGSCEGISSFISHVCNLEEFYERPLEKESA